MDPIFGLPCTSDTRAMELARSRNQIANKKLATQFEALDLAQKARRGKFLTRKSDVQDFLTGIDHTPQTSANTSDKAAKKKQTSSMSLQELDKKLHDVKGTKMAKDALITRSRFPHRRPDDNSKSKSTSLYKEDTTVSLIGAFDDVGAHIVNLQNREQCLTINRKKHAMRDAWDRATSADMQYRAGSNSKLSDRTVSSARSRKAKSRDRDGADSEKASDKSGSLQK